MVAAGQMRHRSVAQRSSGTRDTVGSACAQGRKPIGLFLTCQTLSWQIDCTVFLRKPSGCAMDALIGNQNPGLFLACTLAGCAHALPLHCTYFGRSVKDDPMTTLKTEAMSLRVSPEFKAALKLAADQEHRSQTNFLEYLLFAYCEQNSIPVTKPASKKKTKSQG